MLKRFSWIFLCFLIVVSAATSCKVNTVGSDTNEYEFIDSAGNNVKVRLKPEKVAVLFSSFADIWKTAGGDIDITVAESVERGFADDNALLVDNGAGKAIDIEALIAADPDFVICSADIQAQVVAATILRRVNIPCAEFRVECFDDYLKMLKICTDITGNQEAYSQYGLEVQREIDAVLSKIPETAEKKSILFIRSGSGTSSAKAKTAKQHFAAAMLEEFGARNIADNAPVLLDGLSIEEIIRENPDLIFISTMGNEKAAREYMDSVLQSDSWSTLSAVKEKNYFYLPKDFFQFKPNAKWAEAYRYLARLMYPEIDFK